MEVKVRLTRYRNAVSPAGGMCFVFLRSHNFISRDDTLCGRTCSHGCIKEERREDVARRWTSEGEDKIWEDAIDQPRLVKMIVLNLHICRQTRPVYAHFYLLIFFYVELRKATKLEKKKKVFSLRLWTLFKLAGVSEGFIRLSAGCQGVFWGFFF